MPRRPRVTRFFRDGLPGEDQRVQLRWHLPPAWKALAGLTITVAIKPVRIAGLMTLKEALRFRLVVEITAIPVLNARLAWPRGAVSPLPRWNRIGARPQAATLVSGLPLQASILGFVRGVLLVVPPVAVSDEHPAQVAALNLDTGHSAAVAADVFHLYADVLSTDVLPRGLRGGPAARLRRFRRVDAVEADGYLSSSGAANAKGIPVGNLYDPSCEGLAGLYGSVSSLGLCSGEGGDSDKEKRGQKSGLEESGHVRGRGANVSVGMDLFSLSLPIQCTGPITLLFFQVT